MAAAWMWLLKNVRCFGCWSLYQQRHVHGPTEPVAGQSDNRIQKLSAETPFL
jgi:hypothetical protein